MDTPVFDVVRFVRGTSLKLRIAAGCIAMLGGGYLLQPSPPRAPEQQSAAPVGVPREDVAPILKEEVERREPSRVFRGVQDVGRDAGRHTVTAWPPEPRRAVETLADVPAAQPGARQPAGFGLLVSESEVLTHAAVLRRRGAVTLELPDGATLSGRAVAHEAETGLVLLRLDAAVERFRPTPFAREDAAPGELAVVAAKIERRTFVAPVFIATADGGRYGLTAAGQVLPGLPVFNLNGEALALAAGSAAPGTAWAVAPALERLRARVAAGQALPRSIGLRVQPMTPELEERLGGPGALVSESSGPAARAGVRPGDVITSLGGRPVTRARDALRAIAAASGASIDVELRRGDASQQIEVAPELTLTWPSPDERAPAPPPGAPQAGAVFAPEALVLAQVPIEARVLALDGRGVADRKTAAALLRARRAPWLVYLDDGQRRYFALVGEAAPAEDARR